MKSANSLFLIVAPPGQAEIPDPIKAYYPVVSKLTVVNGLLMRGDLIVTPVAVRVEILDKGHQGISKCKE